MCVPLCVCAFVFVCERVFFVSVDVYLCACVCVSVCACVIVWCMFACVRV